MGDDDIRGRSANKERVVNDQSILISSVKHRASSAGYDGRASHKHKKHSSHLQKIQRDEEKKWRKDGMHMQKSLEQMNDIDLVEVINIDFLAWVKRSMNEIRSTYEKHILSLAEYVCDRGAEMVRRFKTNQFIQQFHQSGLSELMEELLHSSFTAKVTKCRLAVAICSIFKNDDPGDNRTVDVVGFTFRATLQSQSHPANRRGQDEVLVRRMLTSIAYVAENTNNQRILVAYNLHHAVVPFVHSNSPLVMAAAFHALAELSYAKDEVRNILVNEYNILTELTGIITSTSYPISLRPLCLVERALLLLWCILAQNKTYVSKVMSIPGLVESVFHLSGNNEEASSKEKLIQQTTAAADAATIAAISGVWGEGIGFDEQMRDIDDDDEQDIDLPILHSGDIFTGYTSAIIRGKAATQQDTAPLSGNIIFPADVAGVIENLDTGADNTNHQLGPYFAGNFSSHAINTSQIMHDGQIFHPPIDGAVSSVMEIRYNSIWIIYNLQNYGNLDMKERLIKEMNYSKRIWCRASHSEEEFNEIVARSIDFLMNMHASLRNRKLDRRRSMQLRQQMEDEMESEGGTEECNILEFKQDRYLNTDIVRDINLEFMRKKRIKIKSDAEEEED